MHDALSALAYAAAATPTAEPTVDPALVSPGLWGFVVIALLAFAVVGLVWDMMRRIRRGRVRADINEELDAEQQAGAAIRATEVDDQDIAAGGPEDGSPDDEATPNAPKR